MHIQHRVDCILGYIRFFKFFKFFIGVLPRNSKDHRHRAALRRLLCIQARVDLVRICEDHITIVRLFNKNWGLLAAPHISSDEQNDKPLARPCRRNTAFVGNKLGCEYESKCGFYELSASCFSLCLTNGKPGVVFISAYLGLEDG